MLLKESHWELLGGENTQQKMHHKHDYAYDDREKEEEEEEEDELSFCEFSTADHSGEEEEDSIESQNRSSRSFLKGDQDYFEFFSEELRTNSMSSYQPPENILFCGKLIPSKESSPEKSPDRNKAKRQKIIRKPESSKKHMRFNNTRNPSSGHNFSGCLFLFGITRVPIDMELRDIRYRQSRRNPSLKSFTMESDDDNKNKLCMGSMRSLLRALSCSSGSHHHANAVVQAAIIPRM